MCYTTLRGETDYQTDVQPLPPSPSPYNPASFIPFPLLSSSSISPPSYLHLLSSFSLLEDSLIMSLHPLSPSPSPPLPPPWSVPWRISRTLPYPHLPIRDTVVVNQQLWRREREKGSLWEKGELVGGGYLYQHLRQLPLENSD